VYRDPVCKKTISDNQVKAKYTFDRKTYHFCSVECQENFIANPRRYLRPVLWEKFSQLLHQLT
jgi:YHS domain-containing protein